MSLQSLLLGMGGYLTCDAADFDGTAYEYRTAPVGIADGKRGLFSAWIRLDGLSGTANNILGAQSGANSFVEVSRDAANKFRVHCRAVGGTAAALIISSASYTSGNTWYHILASWDAALTAESQIMYVNNSRNGTGGQNNQNIIYTATSWGVGADGDGTDKVNGCLAELWFHTTYMDIADSANRAKFITPAGRPAFLGTSGEQPLGAAPLVYIRVARGAAPSTFATNLGSGGNFAVSGVLTTGSTSPST